MTLALELYLPTSRCKDYSGTVFANAYASYLLLAPFHTRFRNFLATVSLATTTHIADKVAIPPA
jgi:hypothetical protein